MSDKTNHIASIINRAKTNENTLEAYKCLQFLSEQFKYYNEKPLAQMDDNHAKWTINQRDKFDDAIQGLVCLLRFCFALEDEVTRKEDCISELGAKNEALQDEIEIIRSCWFDTSDSLGEALHSKPADSNDVRLMFTKQTPAA